MDANLKRISQQMPCPGGGRGNPGAALQKAADAMSMDLPEGNGEPESWRRASIIASIFIP